MRTHSEKISTVAAGLYAVQKDIANPRKDAKGAVRGGKAIPYLSLPALIDVVKPLLKDHNLLVSQELTHSDGGVGITTLVMSNTGEWIEFGPLVMPHNNDPQQVGAVITYGRRYALAAVLGIAADEDDDAASAKVEPGSTVTGSAAPGMADAEDGATADGEDGAALGGPGAGDQAAAPAPAGPAPGLSTPSGQAEGHHEHHWVKSPTMAGWQWCDVRGCGKARKEPRKVDA
jgi:hypothetical protein